MMLILCSNGLSSEKLINKTKEVVNGCKTAVLIVTADNEYKEKNKHVNRCISELNSLGLRVDIFDLDKHNSELLCDYDVVEFIGGNPFYLLNSIRNSNSSDILKEIAAKKVLIGWSAAVFVFGPTLELVNIYSPDMNFLGLTDLNGLSLTDVQVLPHYSKFAFKIPEFESICKQYELKYKINVIRINDGEGVLINNDKLTRI